MLANHNQIKKLGRKGYFCKLPKICIRVTVLNISQLKKK